MVSEKVVLSAPDYILFTFMLLVSAAIGLFFRFSGGKQKTLDEYLLAGKSMPVLPVAFSIMASYLSAITVIGTPAEVYLFGIYLFYTVFGYTIGVVAVSYICLPVFFKMGACTAYEYLEKRFGKSTRTITSVIFLVQAMLYMSVVLYAPSLALSAVTNLSTWTSVLSVGVVCTFYCTLGGMKAVLWTDLFQALLMFIGVFAVLIKGFLEIGFKEVFKIAYDGGRVALPGFSLSLFERYTVWNILFQGLIYALMNFGANQVQIQRLLTLKSISRSRRALYLSIPLNYGFYGLSSVVGLVIYAHFYKCDPITAPNKPINAADKLLPYYIITAFGSYPGLPGLCICGVFGAALSTVSSAMNSLSAVTMQDLVRPFLESRRYSEKTMTLIAKALTVFYGVLCILMTVLASAFGNLLQASLIVWGMCGGPVLAVFLLGMLTTRSNERGVLIGLLSSLLFTAWIGFGTAANGLRPQILPLSTKSCTFHTSFTNVTSANIFNTTMNQEAFTLETTSIPKFHAETPSIFPLYRISYMWYGPLGLLIGLLIGYASSIIISRLTGEYPDVAEDFVSPVLLQLSVKNKCFDDKEKENQMKEAEHLGDQALVHNSTVKNM